MELSLFENRTLNYLLAISEAGNISKAARKLQLSQPALSKFLSNLEANLGFQVFIRQGFLLMPTIQGEKILRYAREIGCLEQRLKQDVFETQHYGSICICCEEEISYTTKLHRFISSFTKRHKEVDVIFEVVQGKPTAELASNCDFLFSPFYYSGLPSAVHRKMVARQNACLLVPSDYMPYDSSLSLSQLEKGTVLVPYEEGLFNPYMQNWLLAEKETQGRLTCLKTQNLVTTIFGVSVKKGIAIVPSSVKNRLPENTCTKEILDACYCFQEYMYYNYASNNEAARWLFTELCCVWDLN